MIKPPELTQIKDRHGKTLVSWENLPDLMVELSRIIAGAGEGA